jgi:hypothetical protein
LGPGDPDLTRLKAHQANLPAPAIDGKFIDPGDTGPEQQKKWPQRPGQMLAKGEWLV